MNWTRKGNHVCPNCGKKFTTAQGLGLHFVWARKRPSVCRKEEFPALKEFAETQVLRRVTSTWRATDIFREKA